MNCEIDLGLYDRVCERLIRTGAHSAQVLPYNLFAACKDDAMQDTYVLVCSVGCGKAKEMVKVVMDYNEITNDERLDHVVDYIYTRLHL